MSAAIPMLCALALAASDEATRRAEEEVDRALLQEVAATPAPRATLAFHPHAGHGYTLESASFELDGKGLTTPSTEELGAAKGEVSIFQGEVSQGEHELVIRALYAGDFGLLSYMTGYKFKLAQKVVFEARRGLEVALRVAPRLDDQKEWQQRLSLGVQRTETMLAQIDATEPEPMQRPTIAAAEPVSPPPPVETVEAAAPKPAPIPETAKPAVVAVAAVARPSPAPRPDPEPPVVVAAPEPTREVAPPEPAKIATVVQALSASPEPVAAPLPATPEHDPWLLIMALSAAIVALGSFVAYRLRSTSRPPAPHA